MIRGRAMRTLVAAPALMVPTLGSTALAEEDQNSGNYWQRLCTSGGASELRCIGYLEGLHDGLVLAQFAGARPLYCQA
jgi:hypothetical protein